ncbi:flagellar basal-body rod protein FlgG [Chitinimonas lacunae]|uniref:Flagellar basal-body rod protein FlgG n=1 Tax=Chitinimonas lacunae TaxID=1963018 RepID=A0ABV8MKF4_9NEIS
MMRSLWIAKTGMDAMQTNIDVVSNNLANVNTTGFKRGRAQFEDLYYQTLRQPGAPSSQQTQLPTGLQLGTGVRTVAVERIHTAGPAQSGTDFDVMINGDGFFQVQLPDGSTAYTRDGAFKRDNQGRLVTSGGYPYLPGITLPQEAQGFTVGRDGVVTVTLPGGGGQPTQIGNLQLASFINPGGLQSVGENMYIETAASGAPQVGAPGANGLGVLMQQFLEGSNVNITEELVNMIQAQRAYEINSRSIQSSDQMLQRLTQL